LNKFATALLKCSNQGGKEVASSISERIYHENYVGREMIRVGESQDVKKEREEK